MIATKSIVLLARRDHREAMRVASGLTIFGHDVTLVFMDRPVSEADATSEASELLELAEIEPKATVKEMSGVLQVLEPEALGAAIASSDAVVNI